MLRIAKEDDLDKVTDFVIPSLKELSLEDTFPADKDKVKEALTINLRESGIIIYEDCGIIKGVISFGISSFWWSKERFLTNTVVYILPELRNKKLADKFFKAGEAIARELNIPFVPNFMDNSDQLPRKSKYIQRILNKREIGVTLL